MRHEGIEGPDSKLLLLTTERLIVASLELLRETSSEVEIWILKPSGPKSESPDGTPS